MSFMIGRKTYWALILGTGPLFALAAGLMTAGFLFDGFAKWVSTTGLVANAVGAGILTFDLWPEFREYKAWWWRDRVRRVVRAIAERAGDHTGAGNGTTAETLRKTSISAEEWKRASNAMKRALDWASWPTVEHWTENAPSDRIEVLAKFHNEIVLKAPPPGSSFVHWRPRIGTGAALLIGGIVLQVLGGIPSLR